LRGIPPPPHHKYGKYPREYFIHRANQPASFSLGPDSTKRPHNRNMYVRRGLQFYRFWEFQRDSNGELHVIGKTIRFFAKCLKINSFLSLSIQNLQKVLI
jgi:hypothetical protein